MALLSGKKVSELYVILYGDWPEASVGVFRRPFLLLG